MTAIQSAVSGLAKQAATVVGGFPLVNGTPTILTWTAPNDGQQHRVTVFGTLNASAPETGGAIALNYTDPGGNSNQTNLWPGGQTGANTGNAKLIVIGANTTVSVQQTTALTGGAASLWAELWAS